MARGREPRGACRAGWRCFRDFRLESRGLRVECRMQKKREGRNMEPWSNEEFTAQLRLVGTQKYHDKHPFHHLMNSGRLTREQLQVWTANRFYYQKNIPIKDAIFLSRCPLREVRRVWVQRILDHDGYGDDP